MLCAGIFLPALLQAAVPLADRYNRVEGYTFHSGNLVANGSFEISHDGSWFENWYSGLDQDPSILGPLKESETIPPYDGHGHAGFRYVTPTQASGKNAFRLMSDFFALKPATTYTFFYRYQARELSLPAGATIKPTVHFWKARNFAFNEETQAFEVETEEGQASSEIFPTAYGSAYTGNESWTLGSMQFTTPAGTNFGNIFLLVGSSEGASGRFDFDEVYLTEGAVPEGATSDLRHPDNMGKSLRYLDGNGRLVQSVTPDGSRDMVSQIFYDEFGRIDRSTLPIGGDMETNRHRFVPGILAEPGNASDFMAKYYNPSHPNAAPLDVAVLPSIPAPDYPDAAGVAFSQMRYEASPLGRLVETGGPGLSWKIGSLHSQRTGYGSIPELAEHATIPQAPGDVNLYYVKEDTGADGQVAREFRDKAGKTVQKSTKLGSRWVNTEYAYDANGNLNQIVAPGFENRLTVNMEFDAANRMVSEVTAATGTTRFIHDDDGRTRFSQSANQALNGRFTFAKYDSLGRVASTGEILDASYFTPGNPAKANLPGFPCVTGCDDPATVVPAEMIRFRNLNQFDSEDGRLTCQGPVPGSSFPNQAGMRYLVLKPTGEPLTSGRDLWNTYLDALIRLQGQSGEFRILLLYDPAEFPEVTPQPNVEFTGTGQLGFTLEGLSTGTQEGEDALALFLALEATKPSPEAAGNFTLGRLVRTLTCNYELSEALGEAEPKEVSKSYRYDKYGNLIFSVETNRYVKDGDRQVQVTKYSYDIQNRLTKKVLCGDADCQSTLSHIEEIKYDHLGRTASILDKSGSAIVQNHYNFIGQLTARSLDGELAYSNSSKTLVHTMDYHLNGWMTNDQINKIKDNSLLFRQRLSYQDGPNPRFDGSISKTEFEYASTVSSRRNLAYSYSYDGMNRLISATDVTTALDPGGNPITYPDMGGTYSYLDDGRLETQSSGSRNGAYDYDGQGRLREVEGNLIEDRDMDLTLAKPYVFKYDENGNLISDSSKAEYNHPLEIFYRSDNLPYMFVYRLPGSNKEHQLYMAYDEAGKRVSRRTDIADDWVGTKGYFSTGKEVREEEGQYPVDFYPLPGTGRVRYAIGNSTGTKEYYFLDHLGSTREVYLPETESFSYAVHYGPYGNEFGSLTGSSGNITEKFTGKELDEDTRLNYFGARFYDAGLGVWISPDPARQFHSPYVYGPGNPINGTDPDGRVWGDENTHVNSDAFFAAIKQKNLPGQAKAIGLASVAGATAAVGGAYGAGVMAGSFATADGFLFGSIAIYSPIAIPVVRFGSMLGDKARAFSTNFLQLGPSVNQFLTRYFGAVKPEWNRLTHYSEGFVRGAMRIGIASPQGGRLVGGLLQINASPTTMQLVREAQIMTDLAPK